VLLYDRNIASPSRKSSVIFGHLRKSSENVRKMFGNVPLAFATILENLRKSSLNGRKSSENRENVVISMFIMIIELSGVQLGLRSYAKSRTSAQLEFDLKSRV